MCTLVGKTWSLHLEKVVKVDRDENLRMIAESVAFLVGQGKRVIYDAEHFFDGFADDPGYALRCLRAAAEAGAETVTCCDTNGGTLPHVDRGQRWARWWRAGARRGARVGIHCHDDAGCGVANTLAAVERGAAHVQGTMNGYGERCGNANLVTIIPNLQLKLGYECLTDEQLASLTPTAHFFDELLNFTPGPRPAIRRAQRVRAQGRHARRRRQRRPGDVRAHRSRVVGNRREVLISELSGKGTVHARARDAGIVLGDEQAAADWPSGSRSSSTAATTSRPPMARSSCCCARRPASTSRCSGSSPGARSSRSARTAGSRPRRRSRSGSTGERYVRTAEGNGPVNALDRALRDALVEIHPHLRDIELVNFKVRILDETKGTGAVTRVLLDASDGDAVWGSIGVSENVIEASWEALVDSLEYGMQVGRAPDHAATPAPPSVVSAPGRWTQIPLAQAGARRARGGGRCSRCCAPAACRSDRCSGSSSERSPRG